MKIVSLFFVTALALSLLINVPSAETAAPPVKDPILKKINDFTFMVIASEGRGSTFLVSRKRGNDTIYFGWTAAHVVESHQIVNKVLDDKGGVKYHVTYNDVDVAHDIIEDGRTVGNVNYFAEIIRLSCKNRGEDLALLQLRKKNIGVQGVKFYKEKETPGAGVPLWHMGSILGESGFNSTSDGVVANIGRIRNEKVFDQASITAYNGSSGCGLYLKSTGQCIGLVTQRNAAPNTIFYRPAREIRAWAVKTNCLWAFDESIPVPSDEKIRETIVHDIPVLVPKEDLTPTK